MEVFVCLLLACLLRRAACAISTLEVDGAEGRSITFHLQGLKGENLAWSFRGETILTIKLGESPDPSFYEDSYKSRVTFPEDGSALTISQLGKKDAGTYTAKNSVFKASFFLRVYSECLFMFRPRARSEGWEMFESPPSPFPPGVLQEPAVTCASWNCSADGCRYTLHCAVHTPGNKSFSWSHGEQLDAEGPEVVVEAPPLGELDVLSYTCTVRNPVSSSNATVSPAALCADSYRSSFTGTVAAMVIIALIILAVLLAFLIFRGRKICNPSMPGAPATEVAAEYLTVYAEVGIAHQDFPHAQRNDPKKTPAPGVETPKTIYSTIQAMAQVDDNELGGSTLGC
ncbi:SLAM family member 5-like isoform X2 [Cygnus olor]|uniref:SLAM family member 5-like isoform X2 n=1 Tax=Cygnus olor TaxID=8869 RepID=UPI001ADE426F|nr:SLAM family member 5-like isoform X2 [Cygnus olor]